MSLFEWFEFQVPGRVICAEHCVDSIGMEIERAGGERVLLVTDNTVRKAGLVASVVEGMESGGCELVGVFEDVPPGSEVKVVRSCYEKALDLGADALVSVGGGSVMDTAKATAILMVEGGDLQDHMRAVYVPGAPMPPHLAVPTTAGTGSELTPIAVITDDEQQMRLIFQGPALAPEIALLDPVMTRGMPPELTASTGMDALTHCIEAVHSTIHEPITDGLSLHAIKLISRFLPSAMADGADLEARAYLQVASAMGGIVLGNAFAGVVHALANACGGRCGAAHGTTIAVLLPYGMEFNLAHFEREVAPRYRLIAEALGLDIGKDDDSTAAARAIEFLRGFRDDLSLPSRLRDVGVPREGLEGAARDALKEGAMFNNPGRSTPEEVLEFLDRAW
jgi:alcohol dehydrogenase class IV